MSGKIANFKEKFFDYTNDLFSIIAFDALIKEVNHIWHSKLGWDIDDIYFRPFHEFIHPDDRDLVLDAFNKMKKQEIYVVQNLDFRILLKNGGWIWMRTNAYLNLEEQLIYSNSHDINDIKRDQIINEKIQEVGLIGGWEFDFKNDYLYWSKGTYTIFGVDPQKFKLTWKNCLRFFSRESLEILKKSFINAKERGIPLNLDLELNLGHKKIWVNLAGKPVCENGFDTKLFGSIQDITHRMETSKLIQEREQLIKSVTENAPVFLGITNVDGEFQFFNKAWQEFIGSKDDKAIIKYVCKNFTHPDDLEKSNVIFSNAIKNQIPFELELRLRNHKGEYREIFSKGVPRFLNNVYIGHLLSCVDISDRKKYELELQKGQNQINSLVESLDDLIYEVDEANTIFNCWAANANHLPIPKEHMIGRKLDYVYGSNGVELSELIEKSIREKKSYTHKFFDRMNSKKWMVAKINPISTNFGNGHDDRRVSIAVKDISNIIKTEDELSKAQKSLEMTLKALGIGVWEWDLALNTLTWDHRVSQIYGLNENELKGGFDVWAKAVHPEDFPQTQKELQLAIKGEKEFNTKFRVIHKDENIHWIKASAHLVNNEKGEPQKMIGINWDITGEVETLKQLELERIHAVHTSKIAALGEMAGGIAHEINNPLAIIYGAAEQLKRSLENVSTLNPVRVTLLAEKILRTTDRISKIVKGMKSFSRNAEEDPFELVTMDQIISDTLDFGSSRIKNHNIELKLDKLVPNLMLECRSVQVSQVILNLLNNATDAIMGQVDPWIQLETKDLGEKIEVTVTDSGKGIPSELLKKLMTPFFTTKGVGKGTGLGLSISKQIIEETHKGEFFYDKSSPHTKFVIRLPKKHPNNSYDKNREEEKAKKVA